MKSKADSKKLRKELKEKDIVLLVLPNTRYSDEIVDVVKVVADQNKNICYISANKPAKSLVKLFDSSHIDVKRFWFVDCISNSSFSDPMSKGGQKESVILFVSSPKNLTELSITVSGAISNGETTVFVDALSTLMIYSEAVMVVRFAHNLIAKLREYGGKGIFVILKNDVSKALLDDLSMFVDGIVEV